MSGVEEGRPEVRTVRDVDPRYRCQGFVDLIRESRGTSPSVDGGSVSVLGPGTRNLSLQFSSYVLRSSRLLDSGRVRPEG